MDPITMALGLLVTQMMSSKKKDGIFSNLFFPDNSFSSYPDEKELKNFLDKKVVSDSVTIPVYLNSVKSSTHTTSNVQPKPSASKEQKQVAKTTEKVTQKKQTESVIDEKFVMAVVEKVKVELPSLIEQLNNTPSRTIVSETYETVYRSQIAAAQEFLNENRSADLSRVKCLLHKLLPRDYFEYIEQLREHQDPQTIINIMGGQNIVVPSARSATQSFGRGKSPKKGS